MGPQGFLLINKPINYTSFDVIACLRKIFNMKKIGHTGTLDPLATGLMVVALGQATRFLEFHVSHTKEYQVEITLGQVSETYDAEGPITSTNFSGDISLEDIQTTLQTFEGTTEQIPPKYSALKINGKKLCNLARKGIDIDTSIKKRKIMISNISLLSFQWPILKIHVACSSGTYIRSIASDIGTKLGCGAYLSNLYRNKVDTFDIDKAQTLKTVSEMDLLPLNTGLLFPKIELDMDIIQRLQYGQKIRKVIDIPDAEYFQVFHNDIFYGVIEYTNNLLRPKKMVLMD
jgi:tRNA pseudouridine55 synthase